MKGKALLSMLVAALAFSGVAVESDPGRLTRFTVTLPAGAAVLRAPYPSGTGA